MSDVLLNAFKQILKNENLSIEPDPSSYQLYFASLFAKEKDKRKAINLLQKAFNVNPLNLKGYTEFAENNVTENKQQVSPFTEEELLCYEKLLPLITDVLYLQGYLSDILWLCSEKRKNVRKEWAEIVIKNYSSIEHSFMLGKLLGRATALYLQVKNEECLKNIIEKLSAKVYRQDYDVKFDCIELYSKLLSSNKTTKQLSDQFNKKQFCQRLKLLARKNRDNWGYAEGCLNIVITMAEKNNDIAREKLRTLLLLAIHYARIGAIQQRRNQPSAASAEYKQALETYKKIPNKFREKCKLNRFFSEIENDKMKETREQKIANLVKIKVGCIDLTKENNKIEIRVFNSHNILKALDDFCNYFSNVFSLDELKKYANASHEKSCFLNIIPVEYINGDDGRTIGKQSENNDDARFLNYYSNVYIRYCAPLINNYRVTLQNKFPLTKDFFSDICLNSSLVPDGREKTLGCALWLGFCGDFSAAIHILSPQVEHIVRMKFKEANQNTVKIDFSKGTEEEPSLNTLVKKEEFKEIFGEKAAFEIKAIFTESICGNLRNDAVHGLLSDNDGQSNFSIYAWWYVLCIAYRASLK